MIVWSISGKDIKEITHGDYIDENGTLCRNTNTYPPSKNYITSSFFLTKEEAQAELDRRIAKATEYAKSQEAIDNMVELLLTGGCPYPSISVM